MLKYTENEVKLKALKWLLDKYRSGGFELDLLHNLSQEVFKLFPVDSEPVVPSVSERLNLIEQMIIAEGTALQPEILKKLQALTTETTKMEAAHAEWEKVSEEQIALQEEYCVVAHATINSVSRNILNGEIEVWRNDTNYNVAGGYFTVTDAELGNANPTEFWDGYIQAKITELETGLFR